MSTEIVVGWTGDSMVPATKYFARLCDSKLVIGERYVASIEEQRSWKSHRHYFATLNEVWKNWPEAAERQFASAELLRKWALIRCGYRTERQFVASTKAEALRFAAFLRFADDPIKAEDYIEITVRDRLVVEWRAKSQSAAAMGKDDFAKSKDDVLSYLAEIIGTTPAQLQAQHTADQVSPKLLPSPEPPKLLEAPPPVKDEPLSRDDLTVDEAISLLWRNNDRDVHNLSVGGMMIGANWTLDDAIEAIKKSKRRTFAKFAHHELFVVEADGRQSLFETDAYAVEALRKRKSEPAGVASNRASPLTPDDAIALLPDDNEPLHRISGQDGSHEDWTRDQVEAVLRAAPTIGLAHGPRAHENAMLLVVESDGRRSFIEADQQKVEGKRK